jgi:hypothetical protein
MKLKKLVQSVSIRTSFIESFSLRVVRLNDARLNVGSFGLGFG